MLALSNTLIFGVLICAMIGSSYSTPLNATLRNSCGFVRDCGIGQCAMTQHPDPNYRFACRCPNGLYQYESCSSPSSAQCGCSSNGVCITQGSAQKWCNPSWQTGFCCVCFAGFFGEKCEVQSRDPCNPNPCFNNGRCSRQVNNQNEYQCSCPVGFSGRNCEIAEPVPNKCQQNPCGGYECFETPNFANGYVCRCGPTDFRPTNCQATVSTQCQQAQCRNGVCKENGLGQSYCDCIPGFAGDRCDLEYFRCDRNGRFKDLFGCAKGRYLECSYVGFPQFQNGVLCIRECPFGLRYNPQHDVCDYAQNVQCN